MKKLIGREQLIPLKIAKKVNEIIELLKLEKEEEKQQNNNGAI